VLIDRFEPVRNLFIRRWGEMAQSWGISRTMAEIHALLFVATDPLCTDDVMEQLAVSRGSASTNLRQLINWGLIHRVHRRTDRKEYFEAEKDVWQMFETITRERRRREVEPIVETIQRCLGMIDHDSAKLGGDAKDQAEAYRKRFGDILDLFHLMNNAFNAITQMGPSGWKPLAQALHGLGSGATHFGTNPPAAEQPRLKAATATTRKTNRK
jgi:HTH-type transcriptional regulator, glycine betaine synthesis regulator